MPRVSSGDRAPDGIVRVRAPNPSPLTLDGTNTYIAARWVIDPGPDDPGHLDAVLAAAPRGIEGIVLTHGHADHAAGADTLAERAGGVPVVRPEVRPVNGCAEVGPFDAIATPGHSDDHVCLLLGGVCFSGDTVLGAGSVFVGSDGASMTAYLESLERLRSYDPAVICPGHGPFVWDPSARIEEYIAHRLERERRVLRAIEDGARSRDEVLERAWSEVDLSVSEMLRLAAAATMDAHIERLREQRRLPEGSAFA
jgi:glyoxylase-like metal-dependent hydrolase (beta-lactamase superfamily II)